MARGRPPQPRRLKVLTGSARKDRERKGARPKGTTTPPKGLDARALAEWRRLAPELEAEGLLTRRDREAFATYCDAVARVHELRELLTPEYLREQLTGKVYPQALAALKFYEGLKARGEEKFGLSPADRRRVEPVPEESPDSTERYFFTGGRCG